ncbi:HK97-gp10 family putative phage morphogenesis protein [Candidatus Syntrophocurvum alkaliphilum]|nr:HK97-gp10 family putative phage morphogenesis protein [Candidatus Syntrophocurvum alkaliphilum]
MELVGMQELLDEVQKLGDKAKRIENSALRKAGNVVEEAIKSEAPTRTGTLKRSISTSGIRTKDGAKHVLVGPGNKVFYSKFIEYGTVKMKANPFMGRGYEKSKRDAVNTIKYELKRGLGI